MKLHGQPRSVNDREKHACVVAGPRAEKVTWNIDVGKRRQNVIVGGRVAVNDARLAAKCAAEGFGIAFLPVAICAEYLASGKLQRILPRASGGERGLWLVYPDRHLPGASRALAETILSELPASIAALPAAAIRAAKAQVLGGEADAFAAVWGGPAHRAALERPR